MLNYWYPPGRCDGTGVRIETHPSRKDSGKFDNSNTQEGAIKDAEVGVVNCACSDYLGHCLPNFPRKRLPLYAQIWGQYLFLTRKTLLRHCTVEYTPTRRSFKQDFEPKKVTERTFFSICFAYVRLRQQVLGASQFLAPYYSTAWASRANPISIVNPLSKIIENDYARVE